MIDAQVLTVDPVEARALYQKYKSHLHWSAPVDDEVRRVYQLVAQGRVVIRAMETIARAGLKPDGTPKLAICRADAKEVLFKPDVDRGGGAFYNNYDAVWRKNADHNRRLFIPEGTWRYPTRYYEARAALPPIPPMHKPKRGLANYHLLWEAEWTKKLPDDPYLLRHIGRGDMWLVVAAWDLTEVERLALEARFNA